MSQIVFRKFFVLYSIVGIFFLVMSCSQEYANTLEEEDSGFDSTPALDEDSLDPFLESCQWDGSTKYDEDLTKQNDYKFQGHVAIYFIVDANANCYHKTASWYVYTCTDCDDPDGDGKGGGGCLEEWSMVLIKDRYYSSSLGKYVKQVAMLVPKTFWYVYYLQWPNSFKASKFTLYWNDIFNSACCDPGYCTP